MIVEMKYNKYFWQWWSIKTDLHYIESYISFFILFLLVAKIQCKRVVLEDADVSKALIEYASQVGIEHLILGSSAKTSLHKYASIFLSSITFCKSYF